MIYFLDKSVFYNNFLSIYEKNQTWLSVNFLR